MNILWVENHDVFAQLAVRQFLGEHAVTRVPSLEEARTAWASGTFEVLLVDYDLDDGKGDEFVREVRQSHGSIRIIATSSHEEGNRRLLEAGANSVCSKLQFGRIVELLDELGPG